MSVRLHIRPLYAHNSSTSPLCEAPKHRHTLIKLKSYSKGPFAGPLTTTVHMTVSVKCRQFLVGGSWTKGGLMLDLASLYMIVRGLVAIQLPPYFQRLVSASSSPLIKFILLWTFTSTPFFSPWLLCNETSYQPMLLCCLHRLNSVWQKGLLTTSYPRHNRPVFNLF